MSLGYRHTLLSIQGSDNYKPDVYYVYNNENLITGLIPTLNGSYKDFENDLQGSSVKKIYISDDRFGLNEVTHNDGYTITSGDLGKFIRFGYRPVALTGDKVGIEFKTPYRKIQDELLLSAITNTSGSFSVNATTSVGYTYFHLADGKSTMVVNNGVTSYPSTADKTIKMFGDASKVTYFEVSIGALKGSLNFGKLTALTAILLRLGTNTASADFSGCSLLSSINFVVNSTGLTGITLGVNNVIQTITLNGGSVAFSTFDLSNYNSLMTLAFNFSNIRNLTLPSTPSAIRSVAINSTGMSQAQVDTFITNEMWGKRSLFNNTVSKTLGIGGTNAAASGTYQAPTGFVLGGDDGTPASPKEMLYVLKLQQNADTTLKYKWAITHN